MKCFYHVDADGICAGYWVNHYTQQLKEKREFFKIDYGMKFPMDEIGKNETVYIVDFSIEPEEMEELLRITKNVIWIDHHATAIKKYKSFDKTIKGIRYDGIAGCMLTWLYFNEAVPPCEDKIKTAPYFTRLIADYDVWKFEYGDETRHFHMAFETEDISPESETWDYMFLDAYVEDMISSGGKISQYRDTWAKTYCEVLGFETKFEGLRAYALNLGMCGSDYFKSVADKDYDILIGFSFDGDGWRYSLRSSKVDVSKLAEKFGGGGHVGAAGFKSKELLVRKCNEE